ncbi:hypothetical protein AcW1_009269 [Taiwanofungus camphoratus]|nr:hypothetical protein AcV5_007294 [Antrodia cinnamomea]KAI0949748.1 hypothetical protein AcW1_009269 [Antrodia cinnamomea]
MCVTKTIPRHKTFWPLVCDNNNPSSLQRVRTPPIPNPGCAPKGEEAPTAEHGRVTSFQRDGQSKQMAGLTEDALQHPDASREDVLRAALIANITGGNFTDTRFYVFSRRTASGMVDKPIPTYANSLTLQKASSHFGRLLSGGFAESAMTSLDVDFHTDDQIPIDVYGYESDSDLDDEELDSQDTGPSCNPNILDKEDNVTIDEHVVGTSGQDDEDVVSSWDFNTVTLEASESSIHVDQEVIGRAGQTVFVKDMAFRTWYSFLCYLCTGEVAFAPLRSQKSRIRDEEASEQTKIYTLQKCSPKSMYRLADKYDLQDLKELSLRNVQAQLSIDNILTELFSKFTSRSSNVSREVSQ